MHWDSQPIPEGSYVLRGFLRPESAYVDEIDTVALLVNVGEGVCKVGPVMGRLDDQANIALGLKALELGFHTLRFHARKCDTVSRHAVLVGESPHFYFYEVDLVKVAKELGAADG
jgi:hypothetical protein